MVESHGVSSDSLNSGETYFYDLFGKPWKVWAHVRYLGIVKHRINPEEEHTTKSLILLWLGGYSHRAKMLGEFDKKLQEYIKELLKDNGYKDNYQKYFFYLTSHVDKIFKIAEHSSGLPWHPGVPETVQHNMSTDIQFYKNQKMRSDIDKMIEEGP